MESETSYINGHVVETKTSRSQVENATNDIEHHQRPSDISSVELLAKVPPILRLLVCAV